MTVTAEPVHGVEADVVAGSSHDALASLPRDAHGFRLRGLNMTRVETFTDAAFAFALTLLVVAGDLPTSLDDMLRALRDIPAFVLSATMLMLFWWGHHGWSRRFGMDDGSTVLLSSLLVFTVLVYVYPLRFMFGSMMQWLMIVTGLPLASATITGMRPENVNTLFMVYGSGFVAMSLTITLLYRHAWRMRASLQLDPLEQHITQTEIGVWLIMSGAGFLSILLAVLAPASFIGVPGWAYSLLGVAIPVYVVRRARTQPSKG